MAWIAAWAFGVANFLPGDSGENSKNLNLAVCQLTEKGEGEIIRTSLNHNQYLSVGRH